MITVDRLKQYIRDFLSQMHVECLIHGNANKQQALALTNVVEQQLKTTDAYTLPLLSRQLLLKREYKLLNQESYRFVTENEYHKSSCTELYLQCGMQSDIANVYIDLVAQILCEPCYNTLRTKEQLVSVFLFLFSGGFSNEYIIFLFLTYYILRYPGWICMLIPTTFQNSFVGMLDA